VSGVCGKNAGVAKFYLGVDPGKGGGMALLDAAGEFVLAKKMPESVVELLGFFQRVAPGATALLEFVHASPQMGVRSAFTFGHGVGRLEAAIVAAGIPYSEIAPAKWQKIMGCRTGGDKNVTKEYAAKRWPLVKVTHAIADALILAECCRLLEARRHAATTRGFQ